MHVWPYRKYKGVPVKMCMRNAGGKSGRRMSVVFIGCLVFLVGFGVPVPLMAAGPTSGTVTIRGAISNIDDVGAYIVNETFLQLYPCEITGKINLIRDKQGKPVQPVIPAGQTYYQDALRRLVPPSGLPRTAFPDFGFFSFDKIEGLAPGGCYKICVKMLGLPYPGLVPLVDPDGKIREIMIPETAASGSSQDMVIDLTKETLMVPDSSNLPKDADKAGKKPPKPRSGEGFWD